MVLAELVPHDLAHEEDLGQTKVVIEQVILRDLIVMAMELGFTFLNFFCLAPDQKSSAKCEMACYYVPSVVFCLARELSMRQ